jgi:hypothetical protein
MPDADAVTLPAISAPINSAIQCAETGAGNFIRRFFRKIKGNISLSAEIFFNCFYCFRHPFFKEKSSTKNIHPAEKYFYTQVLKPFIHQCFSVYVIL